MRALWKFRSEGSRDEAAMEARAREWLKKLNARVVELDGVAEKNREMATALGKARRMGWWWKVAGVVLVATNALTLSALWVFVTPDSFRAFREGIAIQLIRTGSHSMLSLHARRAFGAVVERLLYETPVAALRVATLTPLLIPVSLVTAVLTRLAVDDSLAVALWAAVANAAFLGDDFQVANAPNLFLLGVFAVAVVASILALPPLCGCLAPAHADLWARCRDAALGRPREQPAARDPLLLSLLKKQRRHHFSRHVSWVTLLLATFAFLAFTLDTAIAHD
mmetsp:Transcript_5181/g.15753  ORF Transcript_5181/g.15753 Transcript_5181/m.15753 type:complete len:280 (+) Transcript_5181:2-841(+)